MTDAEKVVLVVVMAFTATTIVMAVYKAIDKWLSGLDGNDYEDW